MAKASGDAYSELLIMGAVAVGVYVLVKQRQAIVPGAVPTDIFGNPIAGSLTVPSQANTVPNIINSLTNLFASTASAGTPVLQPAISFPLPAGPAPAPTPDGVTDPATLADIQGLY